MKHYFVLNEKDDIIAQSRSKELIDQYYSSLSKKKKKKCYKKTLTLNEESRYKLEMDYDHAELWESDFLGEQVHEDNEELYSFAQEEHSKLKMLIKDLSNVIDNYNIHKSDKKILKGALKLLKLLSKKDIFSKAIGFDLITDLEKDGKLPLLKRLFTLGGNKK